MFLFRPRRQAVAFLLVGTLLFTSLPLPGYPGHGVRIQKTMPMEALSLRPLNVGAVPMPGVVRQVNGVQSAIRKETRRKVLEPDRFERLFETVLGMPYEQDHWHAEFVRCAGKLVAFWEANGWVQKPEALQHLFVRLADETGEFHDETRQRRVRASLSASILFLQAISGMETPGLRFRRLRNGDGQSAEALNRRLFVWRGPLALLVTFRTHSGLGTLKLEWRWLGPRKDHPRLMELRLGTDRQQPEAHVNFQSPGRRERSASALDHSAVPAWENSDSLRNWVEQLRISAMSLRTVQNRALESIRAKWIRTPRTGSPPESARAEPLRPKPKASPDHPEPLHFSLGYPEKVRTVFDRIWEPERTPASWKNQHAELGRAIAAIEQRMRPVVKVAIPEEDEWQGLAMLNGSSFVCTLPLPRDVRSILELDKQGLCVRLEPLRKWIWRKPDADVERVAALASKVFLMGYASFSEGAKTPGVRNKRWRWRRYERLIALRANGTRAAAGAAPRSTPTEPLQEVGIYWDRTPLTPSQEKDKPDVDVERIAALAPEVFLMGYASFSEGAKTPGVRYNGELGKLRGKFLKGFELDHLVYGQVLSWQRADAFRLQFPRDGRDPLRLPEETYQTFLAEVPWRPDGTPEEQQKWLMTYIGLLTMIEASGNPVFVDDQFRSDPRLQTNFARQWRHFLKRYRAGLDIHLDWARPAKKPTQHKSKRFRWRKQNRLTSVDVIPPDRTPATPGPEPAFSAVSNSAPVRPLVVLYGPTLLDLRAPSFWNDDGTLELALLEHALRDDNGLLVRIEGPPREQGRKRLIPGERIVVSAYPNEKSTNLRDAYIDAYVQRVEKRMSSQGITFGRDTESPSVTGHRGSGSGMVPTRHIHFRMSGSHGEIPLEFSFYRSLADHDRALKAWLVENLKPEAPPEKQREARMAAQFLLPDQFALPDRPVSAEWPAAFIDLTEEERQRPPDLSADMKIPNAADVAKRSRIPLLLLQTGDAHATSPFELGSQLVEEIQAIWTEVENPENAEAIRLARGLLGFSSTHIVPDAPFGVRLSLRDDGQRPWRLEFSPSALPLDNELRVALLAGRILNVAGQLVEKGSETAVEFGFGLERGVWLSLPQARSKLRDYFNPCSPLFFYLTHPPSVASEKLSRLIKRLREPLIASQAKGVPNGPSGGDRDAAIAPAGPPRRSELARRKRMPGRLPLQAG